jgi:uncharacterized protein (TIGR02145 family)
LISCVLSSNLECTVNNPAGSNILQMSVQNISPPAISISASANPVCPGTQVTFTAQTTNPGSQPVFSWRKNGIPCGANQSVFICEPLDGDVIECLLTSNAGCISTNQALSNNIVMVVSSNLTVGANIAASANPSCLGESVIFTATAINGGVNPSYSWILNGFNVGTNNPSFSYTPLATDQVSCWVTSDLSCANGNPAVSNTIIMEISQNIPVDVVVTPSSNPACTGSIVQFSASVTNGGSNPSFQWTVNGQVAGNNQSTYSCIPLNGDVILCQVNSSENCVINPVAISNPVVMVLNNDLPVSVTISADQLNVCEGTEIICTANAINGGSSPIYQWRLNGSNIGENSPTLQLTPSNGNSINCILTSNLSCATGSPAISNSVTFTVNPNLPVSLSVTASATEVCEGTLVTMQANAINPGQNPVYQWLVNGTPAGTNSTNFQFTPLNSDAVTCLLTSDALCATGSPAVSNSVTFTVNPNLPVSLSVTASDTEVCEGTLVTMQANAINPGQNPVYQWFVNGIPDGTNSPDFQFTPLNSDAVTCLLTSDALCATGSPAVSNSVIFTVNPNLSVSLTIFASVTEVCEGTQVTLQANAINPGQNPVYQWLVNGTPAGTNSTNFQFTPLSGDAVTCLLTSDALCATGSPAVSNSVIFTVNPNLPVGLTIYSSVTEVCEGTQVTLQANAINPGQNPVYQWLVNGTPAGTNSPDFQFTPLNGDAVTCLLTSDALCATGSPAVSNSVTFTVNPNLPVSLAISVSVTEVCEGTQVTLQANAINPGQNPFYQWLVNGTPDGTNSPDFQFTPLNGDAVTCLLTSDALCATGSPAVSNSVIFTVNPNLPVSLSVTASDTEVCEGTLVTMQANAINPGQNPVYQWLVNGTPAGTNSPDFQFTPLNDDVVTCLLTSDALCAIGNPAQSSPFIVMVHPNPVVSFSFCTSMITREADPITLHTGIPAGGTYFGTAVIGNQLIPSIIPLTDLTVETSYQYSNTYGCTRTVTQSLPVLQGPSGFNCGNIFIDTRDNQPYTTVQIGTQCWFSSNLNFGNYSETILQSDNCFPEKYCYGDNISECYSNGGLYHWDELMNYEENGTLQGICPDGWHVPAESEWMNLVAWYGGPGVAGDSLKLQGFRRFNGNFAGMRYADHVYQFAGQSGMFWSSTSLPNSKVLAFGIQQVTKSVSRYPSSPANAFSVRCIKD